MTDEIEERLAFARAVRDLNHAFVGHDVDPALLRAATEKIADLATTFADGPRRDRLAMMQAARNAARAAAPEGGLTSIGNSPQSGFEDRAVAGRANPTSVEFVVSEDGDDVVARFTLRRAFEGVPGRAHGGMVAAVFDDITGWVIGRQREPAFTGELTVRFNAPVPVDVELEVRTRLVSRERRKLFITAEMAAAGTVVATCKATYITVDPSIFAGAPDPR